MPPGPRGSGGDLGYIFVTTETYVTTLISDLLELEIITRFLSLPDLPYFDRVFGKSISGKT